MNIEVKAQSISDFCRAYGISRGTFYNLEKVGEAPKTIPIGRRRVIPMTSLLEWERRKLAAA